MDDKDTSIKESALHPSRDAVKTPPRSGTLAVDARIRTTGQSACHANLISLSSDPPSNVKQPPDQINRKDPKFTSNAETTLPLAPPPRPAPVHQNTADTPDYFSSLHSSSHFSLEPNPFEQSFGNPSSETPGKSLLPSVAALTSPASLLPGGNSSARGYNWSNSLRSGPLSPAMLTGPTGSSDYFDGHLRGGFPTPNESSLRTGLTPGGGGSMFPAPSPNSQAVFQQLASGGATPNTLDFHRTALQAAAARKSELYRQLHPPASQEAEQVAQTVNMESKPQQQQAQQDPFGQHDANDAANGLFLLAQSRDGSQSNNQFAMPAQPNPGHGMQSNVSHETSPKLGKRAGRNTSGSLGGSISGSARGISEMSGDMTDSGNEQAKPNPKGKGKKGSSGKGAQAANGRRKAEDTPSKAPAAKKAKGNNSNMLIDTSMEGMESDEEMNVKEEQYHENGKKMTDEEKRKNFLERNRYPQTHSILFVAVYECTDTP